MASNAQLQQQITELISRWRQRDAQLGDWLAGPAGGGPNGDGRYPLGTAEGTPILVESPAQLADLVSGPASAATDARDQAVSAAGAAGTALDQVLFAQNNVSALRNEVAVDRGLALQYRDEAANFASQAAGSNSSVTNLASQVASQAAQVDVWNAEALEARDEAVDARDGAVLAAQAAEDFAASINPSLFVSFGDLNTAIENIIGAAPSSLDTLQELADALGNDPNFATTVMNQLAGKAPLSHTHSISEVVGLQAALDGKAAVSHTHTISQVVGLQGELDGLDSRISNISTDWPDITNKPSSFPPSSHTHTIAEVTGLQGELNARLLTSNFTWSNLSGKPSSFPPSSHTHTISEVTGLQAAINARLLSADFTWGNLSGKPSSFPPSSHTHTISQITGLQSALDGKVGSGDNVSLGRVVAIQSGFSPGSNVDGASVRVQGNWGGGFILSEGTGRSGMWAGGGNDLRIGNGTASGMTERIRIRTNGNITLNGTLVRSGQGGYLYHGDSGRQGGRITVSSNAPSGGSSGDIWLRI